MDTSVHGNQALSWDRRAMEWIKHVMFTIHPIIDTQGHKLVIMV